VGVQVSSVKGRAGTIRKQLRQRISDHNEQQKSWQEIGKSVDKKIGDALLVAKHDWEGSKNGKTYIQRLIQIGIDDPTSHLDSVRGELEEIFEQGPQKADSKEKGSDKGTADK
jgi:hypothetical protein